MFKGFLLGLLVAAGAIGGYLFWSQRHPVQTPVITSADGGTPAPARSKKSRRTARALRAGESSPEQTGAAVAAKLSPADLRVIATGDDLSRPDVLTLDMADQGSHELSQDEIDARFLPRQPAVIECINRAQPDDDAMVPGKVTVKFRIQRAGTVRGVRVEAPAVLQRRGLLECVRRTVEGVRFAPSNGSQVVSYDFSIS